MYAIAGNNICPVKSLRGMAYVQLLKTDRRVTENLFSPSSCPIYTGIQMIKE
jgi:hypothetical protein